MNHEVELKYRLVDKSALERVRVAAQSPNTKTRLCLQTNTFFDAEDLRLKSKSLSIRLRLENGQAILTLKGDDPTRTTKQDHVSVRLEYERKLSATMAKTLLSGKRPMMDFLVTLDDKSPELQKTREYLCDELSSTLGEEPLVVIGSFSNERTCVPIIIDGVKLELELDQTQFAPDIIHYEVELEIPPTVSLKSAEKYLVKLLNGANASYTTSKGKADRFYSLLNAKSI